MPIIETDETLQISDPVRLSQEMYNIEAKDPEAAETFRASFQRQNSVGSLLAQQRDESEARVYLEKEGIDAEGDFDAFDPVRQDEITEAGYGHRLDDFLDVTNEFEYESKLRQLDREADNREILEHAGLGGIGAQVVAGVVDPITLLGILIPVANSAKGGRVVASIAGGAAAGESVSELALQSTQTDRPLTESLLNVGGATILGGILGTAFVGLSKSEAKRLTELVEGDLGDNVVQFKNQGGRSAGAAEAGDNIEVPDAFEGDVNAPVITGLNKAAAAIRLNPIIETGQSASKVARDLINKLAENSQFQQQNAVGARSFTAVETMIKRHDGPLANAVENNKIIYNDYRKQFKKGPGMKPMNFHEFNVEVSRAVRRGGDSPIPQVAKSAKMNQKLLKDYEKMGLELGIWKSPPDAPGSVGYLTRIWNPDVVTARRGELNDIFKNWLKQKGADLEDQELIVAADQIIDNILGVAGARMPINIIPEIKSLAGSLKTRTLDIEDTVVEKFLENDIEVVMTRYVKSVAPDIELKRAFPDIELTENSADFGEVFSKITDDYTALRAKAKSDGERAKLNKAETRDKDVLRGVIDSLRGTYAQPADPRGFFVRAGRVMRNLNFTRLLGGMTVSAIPDLARLVMINGMRAQGAPLRVALTNFSGLRSLMREVRSFGVGADMILNTRARSIADVGDIYGVGTKFERGVDVVAQTFGKVSLMAPWNATLKQLAGVGISDSILRGVERVATGTAGKRLIRKLAKSGIDEKRAKAMWSQFEKHGETVSGSRMMRGDLWDDLDSRRVFESAVLKDVDTVIVTPGVGDRPLWMSTEMGKTIGQFRSFAFASTNRVLLTGLGQRDAAALNGMLMSVFLGGVVYASKLALSGREISTDPKTVLKESIDRSGMTGIFMDVNNMAEKVSGGQIGLSAITGQQTSRFASRNVVSALFGPSVGLLQDGATAINLSLDAELTEKDVHSFRKLMPYQNVFYARWLLDKYAEPGINEALGAQPN